MTKPTKAQVDYDIQTKKLICKGNWTLVNIPQLKKDYARIKVPAKTAIEVDGQEIDTFDTSGAWLLSLWQSELKKKNSDFHLVNFSKSHQRLLQLIEKEDAVTQKVPIVSKPSMVYEIGKASADEVLETRDYLSFIGQLSIEAFDIFKSIRNLRMPAIVSVIDSTGFRALPIIALLSFMIGIVITYQMGMQLRNYGANVFIVNFLGLSVLREFGPLLTAIMVAGRTGSAFTAQLGIMKINQEIDALNTMGVTPGELLLLPRILGLVIALPLLSMWADIWGVLGGIMMSKSLLGITMYDFLERFQQSIPLRTLWIGLGKTPVFALMIASVGCFEGMKVQGSAESVGTHTTRSVVLSIFLIIVADAIFSVIFSKMKL